MTECLFTEFAEKSLAKKKLAEKSFAEKSFAEKTLAEKTLAEKILPPLAFLYSKGDHFHSLLYSKKGPLSFFL